MSMALSKAEQNALAVSYDVLGSHVELDLPFVKNYLVRGRSELVSDQEVVFFMNTCKMQSLNPLVSGEVYLIKYSNDKPAQMVVGKDAYLRRAFSNPDYLFKNDGITVQRGNQIVQKEGCCLYPGEVLIGGWCRVTFVRAGKERTTFKEVALTEYNQNQANWKSKPSTMINKVAISQCVRDAFPKDYECLYSEEEMIASGAIAPEHDVCDEKNETVVVDDDPVITNEQRQVLFRTAKQGLGDRANDEIKSLISELGHTSTTDIKSSEFSKLMDELLRIIEENNEQTQESMAQDTGIKQVEVESSEEQ